MATFAEVVDAEELALQGLVLADPSLEVRWVATSELPDPTPYLEGGEILLTTGLETTGWRAEWSAYVDRLARAGVAGIGLGVGLTHKQAPASLVSACRKVGMNLFTVPRGTSFVAISRTVVGMLEEDGERTARRELEAQRTLTQAAMREDDTDALLSRLAGLIGGQVRLISPGGEFVASHGEPLSKSLDQALSSVLLEDVSRLRPQGLRSSASSAHGGGTSVVHPVGLRGRPSAYLGAFASGRFSELQRSTVLTTVSLLGLAAERANDRLATARLLRERALQLLSVGEVRAARLVLDVEPGYHEHARLPRLMRFARAVGAPSGMQEALSSLERMRVLAAIVEEELWVLHAATSTSAVVEVAVGCGLRVGVGRAASLDSASLAFESAAHVLAQTTEQAPHADWDRLMRTGVLSMLDPGQLHVFAAGFLGDLVDGDPDLLVTLASFLRHLGSRQHVAEDLGIHRNTVRNRLVEIERVLGGSLDDAQVRTDAWVALQALEAT